MKINKTTLEILSDLTGIGVTIDCREGFFVLVYKNYEKYVFDNERKDDELFNFFNFVLGL